MANNRVAYGIAKSLGIDTDGMSPKEVWEAIAKKKGVSVAKAQSQAGHDIKPKKPATTYYKYSKEQISRARKRLNERIDYYKSYQISGVVSDNDIKNVVAQYLDEPTPSGKSGEPDYILKDIVKRRGWTGTPQKLDDDALAKALSNGGTIIHRGVSKPEHVEQFYNGDLWIGQGNFGNGIYVSPDEGEAEMFGRSLIMGVVDKTMNFAPESLEKEFEQYKDELYKQREEIRKNGRIKQLSKHDKLIALMDDYGKYVALKGYDGYKNLQGKNWVILNRSKIKVRKDNK